MNAKRLKFVVRMESGGNRMKEFFQTYPPFKLNRTEWRGMEPCSCAITKGSTRPHSMDSTPVIGDIEVTYRPKGHITYTGATRYDGWTAMIPHRAADGTPIDKDGKPLKEIDPILYSPREMYPDIEFNDIDFGEFIEEIDDGVKRTTVDGVMEELKASGRFNMALDAQFMAAHRTRPLTKIILSNAPSGEAWDGFGTRIININQSTDRLEEALMVEVSRLMYDFLEGKASVASMCNDDVIFVELSSAVIDCSPNEDGLGSWFDMLHAYTPIGFLEDLAKRVMSVYKVDVSVIEGKKGGLVLRREAN